jgi:hypothetical protein
MNPKGFLLLTSLEDASHLTLEATRAYSLSSLKYMIPECITYRWMGAKEFMNPSLFMKVLCRIMAGKDFRGSPLIQRSNPVSLFIKFL